MLIVVLSRSKPVQRVIEILRHVINSKGFEGVDINILPKMADRFVLCSIIFPQVNVYLCYAPLYYEHLVCRYYQKLFCRYYIDVAVYFWKLALMQTWGAINVAIIVKVCEYVVSNEYTKF
jgi:hypothetical protein